MMLYRSSVGGPFCLNTLYKNLQFILLHFFTLIGTDDYYFLARRYVTLLPKPTSSQQAGTQYSEILGPSNKQSFRTLFDHVKMQIL